MTQRLTILALGLALGCFAIPAAAGTIHVGDNIKFVSSTGTIGGGAFSVDDLADGAGIDALTFCVQRTQYIDFSQTFHVGSITTYADDASGNDPISDETAWIYSGFVHGTLGAYNADAIQAAIWYLEGEWTNNVGNSAALRAVAHTAVLGGWTNTDVRVLNLFYQDGRPAQDQLVLVPVQEQLVAAPVPEPTSLLLFGSGLLAVGRARRLLSRHARPVR